MESRRYPVGAEVMPDGGTHFRVWAPRRSKVAVVLDIRESRRRGPESGDPADISPVSWARRKSERCIDFGSMRTLLSTPIRFRAFNRRGRMGRRRWWTPRTFSWSDHAWPGVPREGQVIYEMHIGTFTPEGNLGSSDW